MALTSTQYSKEAEEVKKLRLLLDTIETHIYSIPMLNDEYDSPGRVFVRQGDDAPAEWQQYQLEELQGAYLMIVLQYWTGNTIARARVRQARFTRIVAVSRVNVIRWWTRLISTSDIPPPSTRMRATLS